MAMERGRVMEQQHIGEDAQIFFFKQKKWTRVMFKITGLIWKSHTNNIKTKIKDIK
jgi:hypothetical protein